MRRAVSAPTWLMLACAMPLLVFSAQGQAKQAAAQEMPAGAGLHLVGARAPQNSPGCPGSSLPLAACEVQTVLAGIVVIDVPEGIPTYVRAEWRHWTVPYTPCRNVRAEVLIRDSFIPVTFRPRADGRECAVATGSWIDLYAGGEYADAAQLQIDHMVPLANAHRSGGWAWGAPERAAYANDLDNPRHLVAVSGSVNGSKSDRGPEAWRPPLASYWCSYATDWTVIKYTWSLRISPAESAALGEMLASC
jgi:hypothetical protein